MSGFLTFTGATAYLLRDNIDTDVIIPSREILSPERTGFGKKLFSAWRYLDTEYTENPEFILNQKDFREATILLSGENFGCGSSREMAVWSLQQFGFKAIIAKSFGVIFKNNCIKNGLLPIELTNPEYDLLAQLVQSQITQLEIDLQNQSIRVSNSQITRSFYFEIEASTKNILLSGEDAITRTLKNQDAIDHFCQMDAKRRPWLWDR